MELCVALDMVDKFSNLKLASALKSYSKNIWLKVGLRSFVRDGITFLQELKDVGSFKIFLDLKLYDIPYTMVETIQEMNKLDIDMLTIHASAGTRAMKMIVEQKSNYASFPKIICVSALTSFSDEEFSRIYGASINAKVEEFSEMAYRLGMDGVVCSCFEIERIKRITSQDFIVVTPGIRPFGEESDDQARIVDLDLAKKLGSDFIVVGRPIYRAKNPARYVEKILESMLD